MKKYEATIVFIGDLVEEFKGQNMVILFDESAPLELKEISVVHRGGKFLEEVAPGDILLLNGTEYKITAVGEVANRNLKNIGHVCLKFDGRSEAELPGNIHLEEKLPPDFRVGDKILILKGQ